MTPCFWRLALATLMLGPVAPANAQDAPPAPPREGLGIDDRRPEQPFTIDAFGVPVQITGSWEYNDERRRNFDLNDARARDRRVRDHEAKIEARARPGADTEVFLQLVGLHETRRTEGTEGAQRSHALERGQSWVKFSRLGGTPWSLQLGRVAVIDRRAWWWDDDLDAVRLQYAEGDWRLDTGLSKPMARLSSADDGIVPDVRGVRRWFGQGTWRHTPRHAIDAFWLLADDRSGTPAPGSRAADGDAADPSDLRAGWAGLRASGEFRPDTGWRFAYWADTAWLRGRETLTAYLPQTDGSLAVGPSAARRVRGQALDLGLITRLPLPLQPWLTLGWARGSGGERSAGLDANFRQTGLHENKARLGGVKRWRVYGELLQPDLSNLAVSTLGAGVRLLQNSSVEVVAHGYRQPVASVVVPGSRLGSSPAGQQRDLGREIDLLVALREWRQWEMTLALSRFTPGEAFAANRRDRAYGVEVGVALNF